jgi:hypothetical protein
VAGSEGTCVLAKAGTEVAGSCSNGEACDGSGNCKTKNGQACTAAAACASGNCVDGVCCDSACTGTCASCNLAGRAGKCSPYPAGTDPQTECGKGAGVCRSTCDGVGSCAYPQTAVTCGTCYTCDGMGTCTTYDYYCGIYGVDGGPYYYVDGGGYGIDAYLSLGGAGGYATSKGGAGGSMPNTGGAGGVITTGRGGSGGAIPNTGGAGGVSTTGRGGSGGSIPIDGGVASSGGRGGSIPNAGGSGGSIPGYGGSSGKRDGGAGDAGAGTNLHKSGCGCEVGQANPADAGLFAPLLVAGLALLLVRKRRRADSGRPIP